jgi:ABC-2 type transport system permease protein
MNRKGSYFTKYYSFFRMRFISGLQYRTAAAAGILTQFFWGALGLLSYQAFYEGNPSAFPMSFQALASYIWLQQAFLALFMTWFFENEIFQTITDGGIVYELCRPTDLYGMWFFRSMANRASKAVLRCMPIIIVASFLPSPYGIGLPASVAAGFWFVITTFLGFLVVVAFCMLIYIITFFTYSPTGIKLVAVSLVEFFAGAVIPLPFLPEGVRNWLNCFPLLPCRMFLFGYIPGISSEFRS